jgi:chromosome segregation ATPase
MKLKQTIALAASIFITCGTLHAGQATSGFLGHVRDPDRTWNGVAADRPVPPMLVGYGGFSVSSIDRYEITVTCIDNEAIGGGAWPYDPVEDADKIYSSVYGLYVNDLLIGEFGTTHRAERVNAAAVQFWKGPASTATFNFTPSTTGVLKVEMRPIDPLGITTSAEYSALKKRRHSVVGLVSFSLNGPGINSSELTALQTQITQVENKITLLQNDVDLALGAAERITNLEDRLNYFNGQYQTLLLLISDQYETLANLIQRNTAAIQQNTGDIQGLLEQQALLQNAVGGLQSNLALLTQTVTANYQELLARVAENTADIAALEAARISTAQALAALETAVSNNRSALETKVQELEDKLTQLGLDKDAQIAALQAQITAIQGNTVTVTELQTQIAQITTQKDGEIAALEAQIAQLNSSQTSQDAQIAQLRNDLSVAQSGALLTSQALQQQIDALNIQRTTQQAEIVGLNQLLDTAKAEKDSEIAALQQQINAAKQTNTSQDVDISMLNSRLAALQVEKDNQIADLNVKIGNLTTAKTETDQQLSEVQTQLTAESAANDQKIASLQGGIDVLLADKTAQDAQIAALQGQMASLGEAKEQQIEDLKSHIQTMTGETATKVAALETRIAALEAQSTENEAEHVAEKEQLERNLASLRKSINSSESSLTTQMWGIGAGAALIGLTSPGVYDHMKTEGAFDSTISPSSDWPTAGSGESAQTGGWFKAPVPVGESAGWIR